ncbi:serine hydrolase domain-containing protein [Streptomyces sp. 6N223]|uniref:serine hydrolase domain-containing protein n=1 Tax=Streptomyces sp. 6N223 TaxID=3457412 RepID=UPI003FCF1135
MLTGPPATTPAGLPFPSPSSPSRSRPLRHGTAGEAGLLADHVARIAEAAAAFPHIPGFALVAVRDGVIVAHEARGYAVRYASWDAEAAAPVDLPPADRVPMATGTLFDLASVTKLFTATVAAQLHEQGVLPLDDPVARHLPAFAATDPAKAAVTVRQLLTHRSGLPAWLNLYDLPDDARLPSVYASALSREPGSGHEYSDLNLITLGALMERVTNQPLDALVAERVTGPLGMRDTLFNPPRELWPRVAATEYQPWTGRGMIRGTVHDENAWALGGVAGHAGIFSTAFDMAVFGQMLCDGGRYAGTRILAEDTVRAILGASPGGLGWQLDQRSFMDALCSPVTAGHTGYTGTSLTVDPVARMVLVLLTNRVHPTRERNTDSAYRRRPARAFARALPVRPPSGGTAWFAATAGHLTVPVAHGARVAFALWYDTDPEAGSGTLALSTDGAAAWRPLPFALRTPDASHRWESPGTFRGHAARRWLDATAALPAGATHLRWTYRTDGDADRRGRGIYVHRVRVHAPDGHTLVFDSERPADAARVTAEGFRPSAD